MVASCCWQNEDAVPNVQHHNLQLFIDSTGCVVLTVWCPTHSVTGGESPE